MNNIQKKSDIVAAKESLYRRCAVMLAAGMSYKAIMDENSGLGLSKSEISRVRKESGISAWDYRNNRNKFSNHIVGCVKLLPIEKVTDLVKLLSDTPVKALQQ